MTSMNSGAGIGNSNTTPTPLQRDLEATAWTEVNKAALGIVADSIEQSFTQMSPRYTSGYYGGYKSSENQPMLDHPLESGRISQGFEASTDESWRQNYDNLVDLLPPELRELFLAEGRKSFDERKFGFVALDNLLVLAAKVMTRASALNEIALGPIEQERALYTQILPFSVFRHAAVQGESVAEGAAEYALSQGPNHPFFDAYASILKQMGNGIKELKQIISEIKQSGISDEIIETTTRLANDLNSLHQSLQHTNLGGNLQILNSSLLAMATAASSLSLYNTGSASLFIGLSLSSIGLNSKESQLGMIGDSLAKIVKALTSGLTESLIPHSTSASHRLLELSLTHGYAALIGLASLAIDPGFGIFPGRDSVAVKSGRFFTFELTLLLLNSSGTIKSLLTPFLQASGTDSKSSSAASEILSQFANLLMIAAGTRDGHQNAAYLYESLHKYLEKGILTSTSVINQFNAEEEISNLDDSANTLHVGLQQAKNALDEKNYEGFLEVFINVLEALNISQESFNAEIDTISKQTRALFQTSFKDSDVQTTTVVNFI